MAWARGWAEEREEAAAEEGSPTPEAEEEAAEGAEEEERRPLPQVGEKTQLVQNLLEEPFEERIVLKHFAFTGLKCEYLDFSTHPY